MNTIEGSADLTLDLMRRVGVEGEKACLGGSATAAITARRREFVSFVEQNAERHLYGITTRHHTGAKTLLDEAGRAEYASSLPTTPASLGDALPQRVTRMIVLARLADILNGTACLRAETATRLVRMLDGELPPVPVRGNGDPGDIIALSHLFRREFDGTLEVGEGMALINGSPAAVAALCDVTLAAQRHLPRLFHTFALASVAANAPQQHYSPPLERAWNDRFQTTSLSRLRHLLDGADEPAQRAYQAPVSFRSAPRILGWTLRCLHQAEACCAAVLPASSNNPIFVGAIEQPPMGEIVSNGGYDNAIVSPTIDALARAWADICALATAQVNQLVADPTGLLATEPEPQISVLYMSSVGWTEEARAAATPTLLSIAAGGQTDTGTLDLLAWRKAQEVGEALDVNLALLAVVAAHTIARKRLAVPPGLAHFQEDTLHCFPIGQAPLEYGSSIAAVIETLRSV